MFITSYKFADRYEKVQALLKDLNNNYKMNLDENNMRVITNAYDHPMSIDTSEAIPPASQNIVRNSLETLFKVPEGESIWFRPQEQKDNNSDTLSFAEFAVQGIRYKAEAGRVKLIITNSGLIEETFTGKLKEGQQEAAIAIASCIETIKKDIPSLDCPYSILSISEQEIVDEAVKYCQEQGLLYHNNLIAGEQENSRTLRVDASSARSDAFSSSQQVGMLDGDAGGKIEEQQGVTQQDVTRGIPGGDPSSKVLVAEMQLRTSVRSSAPVKNPPASSGTGRISHPRAGRDL